MKSFARDKDVLQPDSESPGDRAWQNDLTEEDMPDPVEREDEAHEITLDP